MKLAIILPFYRTLDSELDGPPLSTPMLIGGIKGCFPGIIFRQIDLDREVRTKLKFNNLLKGEYHKVRSYIISLCNHYGTKVSGFAGYQSIISLSDNRIAADYRIPGEECLIPLKKFFKILNGNLKFENHHHYFITVYKANEPDIIASLLLARYLKY